MLHHADGADAIEAGLGHVAVIHQPDLGQILQTLLADPVLGPLDLLFGQSHPDDVDAAAGGRDLHGAPAAAHVQQTVALVQVHLVQDHVELVPLSVLQAVVLLLEDGAGVGHGGAQEEPVEVVGLVVVVADGGCVAPAGVGADALSQSLGQGGPLDGRRLGYAHPV